MEPLTIRRSLPSEVTGDGRMLRGFIPYNSPAVLVERGRHFAEVIRPGAFARALNARADVLCSFNHDLGRLLARSSSGTLTLTDGPDGLRYAAELPRSAADVAELLARGDLRGSSFLARRLPNGERWTPTPGKAAPELCEILSVELLEIGPVILPAYPASEAVYRSAEPHPAPAPQRYPLVVLGLMQRT